MSSESHIQNKQSLRVDLVRRLVQSYGWARGKDRLFLILRSLGLLPRMVTASIAEGVRLRLDLDDYLQRWMFCHKLEEEYDYHWLTKILRKGDHFVDIGANIGIVSLLASRVVEQAGKVYAIEALPETRDHLFANIAENSVTNVLVIPFALLDENREVEFFASRNGNIGGSSLVGRDEQDSPISVTGRTFDSLLQDETIERCDVLKMDIEGAELLALKGMSGLFLNDKPRAVLIEVSEELLTSFGAKPSNIVNFFLEHDYEWYRAELNGFEKVVDLEIKGFNNLWAFAPGTLPQDFLL